MKRYFRVLSALISAVVLLSLTNSCKEPDSIITSKTELSWTKDGGKKTVDITANCDWTVTAPSWVSVDPASGSGNGQITLRAEKNEGLERKDILTLSGGEAMTQINLVQAGVDFSASQLLFEFTSDGTPIDFTIVSTSDWTIQIPQDASWITAEPLSGKAGETTVRLTPAPIVDRTPRERTFLTVDYGKSFTMLTVSQALPNDPPTKPELIAPEDGAVDAKINAYFNWKASTDPDGDVVSYKLMISEDNGSTWSSTQTTTTRTRHNVYLTKSTQHLWKVQAIDAFGAVSESETRSFTTGDGGAYKDGEVTLYQSESAGAPKPVHLVFMGDGFIEDDYTEGGAFDQAVETAVNTLFSVEPYATYKDYFRISTVAVYSPERGATVKKDMNSVNAQIKNTAFDATLEGGNSTGTSCNYDKVFSYALKVPGVSQEVLENTTVFLLININAYAGTCMMESNGRSVSMCPMGKNSFGPVVVHEGGGHGFGRLLDEYKYYASELPADTKNNIKSWRGKDPYYAYNIDLTGDRSQVHWAHYFTRSGYEAVGLYEGACLYEYGVWRAEYMSCMDDNRYYFNAPSREAIVRRIMRASGKTFNMENFIANDKVKSDNTGSKTKADYVSEPFVPFAPPILVER
ncbi:MAG: hypothetical protein IKU36_01300 [Bacteroidales bacterium]|nr:hypothetical protein [Bacteroidales bacterium]